MHTPNYKLRGGALAACFLCVYLGSFALGRYGVGLWDVICILWTAFTNLVSRGLALLGLGPLPAPAQTWTDTQYAVVVNIRLPRITAAALVGGALSTAGAAYQGMFRNPMVSPDLLGASTGAGFGAALGILLGFGYFGITAAAFLFGVGAVLLAYLVSRLSRLSETLAMVLAGIMIGSLFSAGTSFIKLVADTQDQLPAITYWLMGSLASVKGPDAAWAAVPILMGFLPLFGLRWRINLLTVSEEEARSLGVNTGRLRLAVILCATLMTAASVSISGMIGWVGLVIPHFCRRLFGYDYARLIPASALFGAAFLIVVDDVSRLAAASEIPLGILTAFVGAPLFVWLILRGGARHEA